MKKVLLALAITALATTAFAGVDPATGVVGSKHDMNVIAGATDDAQGRVCAFCHTPHHAIQDADADYLPLWSHDLTTQTTYTPYWSPTLDADVVDPFIGPSRLCMSCHDGVIAVDQHYGSANTGLKLNGAGADDWGGRGIALANADGTASFNNDHPVGFDYIAVAGNGGTGSDPEIFAADGRAFKGNTAGVTIADTLYDGVFMTCATCHDVHNKTNASHTADPTRNYFVYSPQDGSALCLTCHDKGDGL